MVVVDLPEDVVKELLKYGKDIREAILSLVRPRPSIHVDLGQEVPPETMITRRENYVEAPWEGILRMVVMHFPPGCNGLVKIKVGVGNREVTDWIALDDTTQVFEMHEDVMEGERVWAEIRNEDTTYPHRPAVIISLIKKPEVIE